jgi:hypothetical protein
MIFLYGNRLDIIGKAGGAIGGVQLATLFATILFVEASLKKSFHADGSRIK